MRLLHVLVTATLMLSATAFAQSDQDSPSLRGARLQLGKTLFMSQRLSVDGTVSCATCHDPKRSFADGLVHAQGIKNQSAMRNSATLWGMAEVAHFPGAPKSRLHAAGNNGFGNPALQVPVNSQRTPNGGVVIASVRITSLSLEERCLGPIENPAEMGHSLPVLVEQLRKDPAMVSLFEDAFGKGNRITSKRVGEALAAYVRSLEAPDSPYARYLSGDAEALTVQELRGQKIFQTSGRCTDCHKGPAMTDGKLHLVWPSMRRISKSQIAKPHRGVRQKFNGHFRGSFAGVGGYGGPSTRFSHTLTLLDINRTAPYFRDGRTATLRAAVEMHVTSLRRVGRRGRRQHLLPAELRPKTKFVAPDALNAEDLDDLLCFLKTLSPRTVEAKASASSQSPIALVPTGEVTVQLASPWNGG